MKISSFTHKGMVRSDNEDAYLVVPPWGSAAISSGMCVFAVADGMGGHNAGEIASGIAVQTTRNWLNEVQKVKLSIELVEELFGQINHEVWKYSQQHPDASGMGTTLTMLLIQDNKAICGHIGDSRMYRLRNGQLQQLTNDHTLVAEQVRNGKLTPEQARVHPARHILSKVIGIRQFVSPEIFSIDLQTGDLFLLCSDGVCSMIDDTEIMKQIQQSKLTKLAYSIIDAANSAGGKDNCTAVTIKIESLPVIFPGRYSFARLKKIISYWCDSIML